MSTTFLGGEGQTPTPPADGSPAPEEGEEAPARTVEEVETQWKYRVSQKDKAHAAAEQALRDENDRLKAQLSRATSGGQSGNGGGNGEDAALLREQLAQSQREVEQERAARAVEAKRAKYPSLARQVGESGSSIFATADDATLARLNALADDEAAPGSTFAPATPRKPAPVAPKSLADMDKAQLEAALRQSVGRGDHKR